MKFTGFILLTVSLLLAKQQSNSGNWNKEQEKGFNLYYSKATSIKKAEYSKFISKGIKDVKAFFSESYKKEFSVYVHPDRKSLDSTWQKDWAMPGFKSECWMVASGVASRLDMIAPETWDKESCEHKYAEKEKTQRLITHELVHVFHGQQNPSPDFSEVSEMDWFVEGLAAYASGQCDATRIAEIKKASTENKLPASLNDFWKGKLKYGLSGCAVMYIDKKFGRVKLKALLSFTKKSEVLAALGISEEKFMEELKIFLQKL